MVAAEAASCGVPPLVAYHSGLAEIADSLREAYPDACRELACFDSGDVDDLAAKLDTILALAPSEHARMSEAARRATVERWSWERVATRILSHVSEPD